MKQIISSLAAATSVALLAVTVMVPAGFAFASSIDMTQTVASAPAGANTQTIATSSVTANVPEVKATRTLTVSTAPIATNTIIVGGCTVTFATTTSGVGAQDLNCNDSAATVRTATTTNDVAKTTTQIANDLLSLVNVTGVHGALAVTASSTSATSAVFTTAGTETSATPVTFTDGTSGKIVTAAGAGANVTGVIPVAQVFAITPASVETGDRFAVNINGTTATYTATAATVANVTAGLTAAINASAASTTVTASDQTTAVNVTAKTAGTAFTINTATATNLAAVAQTVTFTPSVFRDFTYTITLNGVNYSATGTNSATPQSIVEAINAALSGNPTATCSEDDVKVTCVAVTPGTSFTYDSSISGGTVLSSGGGGGGGGSHTSSSTGTVTTGTTGGTTTTTTTGSTSVSFTRNLTVGSTGADVMALQAYLNAHGYMIAMTGPGSKGMETTHFGALTKAALAKLQAANAIVPAAGYFGPKTRAWIAAHP